MNEYDLSYAETASGLTKSGNLLQTCAMCTSPVMYQAHISRR